MSQANKCKQNIHKCHVHFYLRPRLLCRLALWSCFTSSCFVVPQSPALESYLTLQILHRFGAPTNPPPSRWRRWHLSYPVALAVAVFAASCNKLLTLLQMAGGRFGLHAISEYSNRNALLPKSLGRTTVPLQQQRAATGAQRVWTLWTTGTTGVNYASRTGVERPNNG